jgi:NAD(P)H-dependent flavin oxidoreductase YrpB (nitropropane dioxygenase family)
MLHTRICDMLGIEHPIISAPMSGGTAAADLAAAVSEAGGHTGYSGTLPLVTAVLDIAGNIPVLAAGGIADGRGLAAVLVLGAEGAWLGTRFYASRESGGSDWEKVRMLEADTKE